MRFYTVLSAAACIALAPLAWAEHHKHVPHDVIAKQRAALAANAHGFGPQSPRDIDSMTGKNPRVFGVAPPYKEMNLCNIHLHKNAEHKGGEFTVYAGNGDGHGNNTGYRYAGHLTKDELKPIKQKAGKKKHAALVPGDTIEIHFVHSSAAVRPGPTLGACISDKIKNPDLRVETVVGVLVNDPNAANFVKMAKFRSVNGLYQASNLPNNLGKPVVYAGATTGPSYNEKGSPFQVTWSVRPKVIKIAIRSVKTWFKNNDFNEKDAHGVRNLVINEDLLSPIE